MTSGVPPLDYGPASPFDSQERGTIEAVYTALVRSEHPQAEELQKRIHEQIGSLEFLGQVMDQYPSPLLEEQLGRQKRSIDTLVDTLSQSNPANFEFFLPTRALLGQALDRAESNFYRLLQHVCREILEGDRRRQLLDEATQRLRACLYTRLAEDVLSAIAAGEELDRPVRAQAVRSLAQIWEHRLTYRVSDFFPIIEATWEARQRIAITGGTLAGTQEILALFAEGCDPKFVDYFTGPDPTGDRVEAFREFLFATPTEELARLTREMTDRGNHCIALGDAIGSPDCDSVQAFYEFFRSRYLQAMARRVSGARGPKHTAEGYVMMSYLSKTD
ncbi:MAG: hypothetical protein GY778_14580 [bacterium]|nr:hypothetical protein [bacterium]